MKIDAVLSPPEIELLPSRDLRDTTCVVFDVLRATSSMITALASGASAIYPVKTIEEALALKRKFPSALLGGERNGDRIDGFDIGNSPLEYRDLNGRSVITTTTNGTIALCACASARETLVGALINLHAVIDRIKQRPEETLLLVCAGTFRDVAIEDVIAAGAVCAAFSNAQFGDGAQVAASVFQRFEKNVQAGLETSRNGTVLLSKGRREDVAWCAQKSIYSIIGIMKDGKITARRPT